MTKTIGRTFYFDAAHRLPDYNGKCKNLHGHTWRLDVFVTGTESKTTGMIMDFKDLDKIVTEAVIDQLDHKYLNEEVPIKNPTAENIIDWIWEKLWKAINHNGIKVSKLKLYESRDTWVEYIP